MTRLSKLSRSIAGKVAIVTGAASGMARASELSAPAPNGHLLRMFGSSDRDLIDSASREPNMAQVLSIMNGYVEKMVVSNRSSAAYKALEAGSSNRDKVRFLYYSILSRSPTPDEMALHMRSTKLSGCSLAACHQGIGKSQSAHCPPPAP